MSDLEKITQDGGILKKIIQEGDKSSEKPTKGSKVTVHYTGKLNDENGSKFDSSVDRNEPFVFGLGEGKVIKGWDVGVATMHIGEKAAFYLQPDYGYGAAGAGESIPPNSVLYFEVELISWTNEEDISPESDGSILKKVLKSPGDSDVVAFFNHGTKIKLDYKTFEKKDDGSLNLVEEKNDVDVEVSDFDSFPTDNFEKLVKSMSKGEKSRFTLKNEKKVYEIELKEAELTKNIWDMDLKEKCEGAEKYKTRGNNKVKAGDYEAAKKNYFVAQEYLNSAPESDDPLKKQLQELKVSVHNNVALCLLRLKEYDHCVSESSSSLDIESDNLKALLRRSEAYFELRDYDRALGDIKRALTIDPSNTIFKNKLKRVNDTKLEIQKKEKKMYSRMFSKPLSK